MRSDGKPNSEYRDYEFNLRELAGSMGDFGTLFPLAVSYIAINGLDPAGLFVMLGLTNIALGLIYRLPMPLQPKKIIAVTAITQQWQPSLIYASGFGLGILWIILSISGLLKKLVQITPDFLVRGVQLALALTLGWQALQWMQPAPLLGIAAIVIVLALRQNRYAPAAIVLMVVGFAMVALEGNIPRLQPAFTLPPVSLPRWQDIWQAMLLAGFAQIPLSITNAVIAPAAMIRDYFPKKAVEERKLMLNMGVMNAIGSLFSGIPICHGAGGLAGQYYFGARTGGASIMEGLIELAIGLFLSQSIADILTHFPMALIAGMMLMVAIQLALPIRKLKGVELGLAIGSAVISVITNIGIGFLAGLAVTYALRWLRSKKESKDRLRE
jgi:MFS superfamily sulfate permease-like transporter